MAELQQPDQYKETMKARRRLLDIINPDLFEDCRIDSGPDPYAPKPIHLENHARVVKLNFPSANMPTEKFSDFDSLRAIDKSFVTYVKKYYSNKEK